jgi:hypothetical protein
MPCKLVTRHQIFNIILPVLFIVSVSLAGSRVFSCEPGPGNLLFRASVDKGDLHLKGYLVIYKVADTIHNAHTDHTHGCPVDSCLLGLYHRAVCGNESGMNFLDLIIRADTIQVMHIIPSLKDQRITALFEKMLRTMISEAETTGIPERISKSDPELDLEINLTLLHDKR